MAMVCGDSSRHDSSLALAVKVAITIGHLRARRWDRLQASEALTVADALDVRIPEDAFGGGRYGMATVVTHDVPVEFVFPWRPGNARNTGLLGTSTSHVGLAEVEPVDAPVACSLWTPEGRLDLRRHESAWLRPVLSPGSWRPITVPEFREAARSGCSWSDNPFLPRPPRGLPTFHVLDVAGPQPLTAANARRMSDALDTCLVSAGQLHVIDGIVHRLTGPPTAGIGTTFYRDTSTTGPAWRVDGLASTQDVGTFGDKPVATWCNGVPIPDRSGSDDPDDGFVALPNWTGVSRLMIAHVRRVGGDPERGRPTLEDLMWPLEPLPSTPDIPECLRVAANMATRLIPLAHGLGRAHGDLRTCVRLKDALTASKADLDAGREVEDRFLEMIGALCAEVLGIGWPAADPREGMWTYVASLASYAAEQRAASHTDPQLIEVSF